MTKPGVRKLKERKLTLQQMRFVQFVVSGQSPSEAAISANYGQGNSKSYTPAVAAYRLMSKPWILAAIRQAREQQLEQKSGREVTANEILADLDRIAADCITSGPNGWSTVTLFRCVEMKAKLMGLLGKAEPEPPPDPPTPCFEIKFADANHKPLPEPNRIMPPSTSMPAPRREPAHTRLANSGNSTQAIENTEIPSLEKPVPGATKTVECQYHGPYQSEFKRHPSGVCAWSYCEGCTASAGRDQRWLDSLS